MYCILKCISPLASEIDELYQMALTTDQELAGLNPNDDEDLKEFKDVVEKNKFAYEVETTINEVKELPEYERLHKDDTIDRVLEEIKESESKNIEDETNKDSE